MIEIRTMEDSRDAKKQVVSGYWFWEKWYDRIFRWKTVCFKVGDNTWKFRRKTWTMQTGWIKFEDRK